MINKYFLGFLLLGVLFSCESPKVVQGDFFAAYQQARQEHKYLWMVIGGGENCISCNNAMEKMQNSGVMKDYQKDFIFFKGNSRDSTQRFLQYIYLPEAVPNSYIFNPEGKLVYYYFGFQTEDDIKQLFARAKKNKFTRLSLHGQFNSKNSDLLKMQDLVLKAYQIYRQPTRDSLRLATALQLIDESIAIEPYFFNLYLKSCLHRELRQSEAADSCASLALKLCHPGYQTIAYEPLVQELKNVSSTYQEQEDSMAKIKFENEEINCGTFPNQTQQEIIIPFENIGKKPLLITFVSATCGCAKPIWETTPVKPGEKGKIKINYDANGKGTFVRSVYVQSNASNNVVHLTLKGKVE